LLQGRDANGLMPRVITWRKSL